MHVCLLDNSKTNDPKVFRLGVGKNDLRISYRRYGLGSKGQSSRSWSCKPYLRRASVPPEFAFDRVTLDDEMIIFCRTTTYTHQSGSHSSPDVDAWNPASPQPVAGPAVHWVCLGGRHKPTTRRWASGGPLIEYYIEVVYSITVLLLCKMDKL